jgi:Zn-dependent protease with chaperone function
MTEHREPPTPPQAAAAEYAWAARRAVGPVQADEAHLGRCRHPSERRSLLTVAAIIGGVELVLILLGPQGRVAVGESIRSNLHWVPPGILGPVYNLLHPGGVTGTVLGIVMFTSVLDLYNHWLQRAEILSESSEVTALTFPTLFPLVKELCERFALPSARVFVRSNTPRPYTVGMRAPHFIVIPVSLLGTLTEDELRFVLGREMGHVRLGHTLVAPFLGGSDFGGSGILALVLQVRSLILSAYQRAQELSADRVGVVASHGIGPGLSAAIKLSVGAPRGAQLDIATLAPQAAEVQRGAMSVASRLRQVGKAQPPLFLRLKELVVWPGLPADVRAVPPSVSSSGVTSA